MRQIVLDTETTGLDYKDGHRIIEIGAVELINRRLTGKHFHCYINPQREIDAEAVNVHGITQAFLTDKPTFNQIATNFIKFIEHSELIIHNASFDIGFINHEFSLLQEEKCVIGDICQVIDTLLLARQKHPGQKNSLDALCKRYGIDNSKRDLHGALLDAQLLAHVYLAMTGGQTTLFNEQPTHSVELQTQSNMPIANRPQAPLTIIHADAAEENLHQMYLAKIAKSAENGCLWQKLAGSKLDNAT